MWMQKYDRKILSVFLIFVDEDLSLVRRSLVSRIMSNLSYFVFLSHFPECCLCCVSKLQQKIQKNILIIDFSLTL